MQPLKVIISGVDRFGSVFRRASKGIGEIGDKVDKFHKKFEKAGALLGLGGGLLTIGTGLHELPKIALEQEHGIAKIGVASNLSGAALAKLDKTIQDTTRSANQFDNDVEGSAAALLKMQFAAEEVGMLLPIIGRAATATGVPMQTLAQVAGVFRDRLGIAPDQMGKAFDQLIEGSKMGKVTLEDMASGMTGLASHAALLGIKGPGALSQIGAALQITARQANSSSEAVGALEGVFDNLGKEKILKTLKGLQDMGIKGAEDGVARYFKIIRESADPLSDLVKMIGEITGGDAAKLSHFFKGKESVIAMQDLIAHTKEYGDLRGRIGKADGVAQRDFNVMMDTTTEKWKQFKIQLITTALPLLEPGLHKLNSLLGFMNSNATAVKVALYSIGGALAGSALLIGIGTLASSISAIVGAVGALTPMLPGLAAGFATIGLPVAAVAGALTTAYAAIKGIQTIIEVWNAKDAADDRRESLRLQLQRMGKTPEQVDALMLKYDASLAGNKGKAPEPVRTNPWATMMLPGSQYMGAPAEPAKKTEVEVKVKFDKAPPGTRVETKATKGVTLGTELGMAF